MSSIPCSLKGESIVGSEIWLVLSTSVSKRNSIIIRPMSIGPAKLEAAVRKEKELFNGLNIGWF